jgi:hypothetical protein
MQTDGNLCVYRNTPEAPNGMVWCSMALNGQPTFTAMQNDGNLAVYKGS